MNDKFVPKKQDKEVITVRISSDMLIMIDKYAGKYDVSRNEFITQCINYAIQHMEDLTEEK